MCYIILFKVFEELYFYDLEKIKHINDYIRFLFP